MPAPRWAAISGIALVAGSAAAARHLGRRAHRARSRSPQRDIARLGDEPDPLAVPLLERFGEQVRHAPAPTSGTGDVRALARLRAGQPGLSRRTWRSGPADGSLHRGAGARLARPAACRCSPPWCGTRSATTSQRIVQLARIPGVHYVLMVRVGPDEVMTAAVGPRSQLVMPGRVGRLLRPGAAPGRRSTGSRSRRRPDRPPGFPGPAGAARAGLLRNEYPAGRCRRQPGWCTLRWTFAGRYRCSCGACWSCCSTRRCWALSGFWPELVSGAPAAPAPLAKPVPLLPHPARGDARRVLHPTCGGLRGVELRPPGR